MMNEKRKIGCFFGTFDPIHNGHVKMAREVLKKLNLDEVLIIPLKGIPHKHKVAATVEERYKMCALACEGNIKASPLMTIFDVEGYDLQMIHLVQNFYKDSILYYLVGSDVFVHMHQWDNVESLLKTVVIAVAMRDDAHMDALKEVQKKLERLGGQIVFLDIETEAVSSTVIRDELALIRSSEKIHKDVVDYILKNNLYLEKKY
ncbi:MAG: nicotinate (nicotinamide) nucleotide adenylyltransferase [Clostridia bacterium]|nr:nicotinate (nicotinamide) nucleotide adenylyltransferase [Clostridia bacterium]